MSIYTVSRSNKCIGKEVTVVCLKPCWDYPAGFSVTGTLLSTHRTPYGSPVGKVRREDGKLFAFKWRRDFIAATIVEKEIRR